MNIVPPELRAASIPQAVDSAITAAKARKTDQASVTGERMQLLANGYQPIDIKPSGKGELHKRWSEFRGLPTFNSHYSSTSILSESLRAFDFDIEDPEIFRRTIEIASGILDLTNALQRGREGSLRSIFLFRASRPVASAAWPRKRRLVLVGKDNATDILGAGQQFLALGPHPPSSKPYYWPHGSPLDRPYHTLPIATEEQIDRLTTALEAAGLLASDTGRDRQPKPAVGSTVWGAAAAMQRPLEPLINLYTGEPVTPSALMTARIAAGSALNHNIQAGVGSDRVSVAAAIQALNLLPNDFLPGDPRRLSRDGWRDIAFSLHAIVDAEALARGDPPGVVSAQYQADDAAVLEAFRLFSDDYAEDPDKPSGDTDKLWESTRNPREITAGTFRHFVRQHFPNYDFDKEG